MKKIILASVMLISAFLVHSQSLTASFNLPKEIGVSSTYVVETSINKGAVSGFIKLSQILPAGFIAEDIDCKGASFTFNEDGIRIIWMTPPPVASFTIKYKITTPSQLSGTLSVITKIIYMVDEEKKSFDFPIHTFSAIQSTTVNTSGNNSTAAQKTNPVKAEVGAKVAVVEKISVDPVVPTSVAPASSSGKTYKVQIGAYSTKPKVEGVPEISTLILDNGITKYFSGNFVSYDEAVKRKNLVAQKGFAGAFIVSFQDGKIVK